MDDRPPGTRLRPSRPIRVYPPAGRYGRLQPHGRDLFRSFPAVGKLVEALSPALFRANSPTVDGDDMERDLTRIPGVSSANVVVGDQQQVLEIHLVASGRDEDLIRRDVQTLLAARWGLELDAAHVSLLELDADLSEVGGSPSAQPSPARTAPESVSPAAPAPSAARAQAAAAPPPVTATGAVHILSMSLSMRESAAQATVTLSRDGLDAVGEASGVPSLSGQQKVVAAATLAALEALDQRLASFSLVDVTVARVSGHDVVVSMLASWEGGVETQVVGAARVGPAGDLRAVAESVTQAGAAVTGPR